MYNYSPLTSIFDVSVLCLLRGIIAIGAWLLVRRVRRRRPGDAHAPTAEAVRALSAIRAYSLFYTLCLFFFAVCMLAKLIILIATNDVIFCLVFFFL